MDVDDDFVPTKGSSLIKDAASRHQLSVHVNRQIKKSKESSVVEQPLQKQKVVPINMAKAKHEVMRFGISGFDKVRKQEAKMQLAIKLGAKPPRRKYKNYKKLIVERKLEKDETKKDMDLLQLGKNKTGKSTAKGKSFDKKRKKKEGILNMYGIAKTQKS